MIYFRDDEEAGCSGRHPLRAVGLAFNVFFMCVNVGLFIRNVHLIQAMRRAGVFKKNATCLSLVLTLVFNVAMFGVGVGYCIGMTTFEKNKANRNLVSFCLLWLSLTAMPTVLTIPVQWMDIAMMMDSKDKVKLAKRFRYMKRFIFTYSIFFVVVSFFSVFMQRNEVRELRGYT